MVHGRITQRVGRRVSGGYCLGPSTANLGLEMAALARDLILPLTEERGGAECDARGADAPKEGEREREREREHA